MKMRETFAVFGISDAVVAIPPGATSVKEKLGNWEEPRKTFSLLSVRGGSDGGPRPFCLPRSCFHFLAMVPAGYLCAGAASLSPPSGGHVAPCSRS